MMAADLGEFIATARPNQGARAMMRLSLFDWAICGFAGRSEAVTRIARTLALKDGGAEEASVFGSVARLPVRAAALCNGTAAHALDYDDTHFDYRGSPSAAVIPAALAVAQRAGCNGSDFLDACLVGVEMAVRVGTSDALKGRADGHDPTATAGSVGAAAAVARLFHLDPAGIGQTLLLAAEMTAGLRMRPGTMTMALHAGLAAAAGFDAAQLCAAGLLGGTGSSGESLHDARGEAWAGLGDVWRFDWISHRTHACCQEAHAMLEALASIAPRIAGSTVETVEIALHPAWRKMTLEGSPKSGLEVRHSLQFLAAMALDGVDTTAPESFADPICQSPRLRAYFDRVSLMDDTSLAPTAAKITLRLSDGRKMQAVYDKSPVPMPDRATRLRGKARALVGDVVLQPFWEAITAHEAPDLQFLSDCMAGKTFARAAVAN